MASNDASITVHSLYDGNFANVRTGPNFFSAAGRALNIKKADLAFNDVGNPLTLAEINTLPPHSEVWIKTNQRGVPKNFSVVKLVVMGPPKVGKSAITFRYLEDSFVSEYDPTLEDSWTKTKTIDGVTVTVDILDTAGLEGYMDSVQEWIGNKDCIVWVYDITNRLTWQSLQQLYNGVLEEMEEDLTQANCIVFGNKSDKVELDESDRKVTYEEVEAQCNQWNVMFEETSARKDVNVNQGFVRVIRTVLQDYYAKPKSGGCAIL